ncbi:MAG: hypothetical protein HY840_11215 [Bacteroidetes bacterium]|nr:hypothetical protein [Bacteroidota bacterium]
MKKTSAALFELIRSLSMAEKKYFKIFSSLQSGDKSYLKLYDAIERQRVYNEDDIRRTCRGQNFLLQLPVAKNRLYSYILRSLEIYHNNADINLRRQISKAGILLEKGLTTQALRLLKTSKAIAYEHERWELLMEILVIERTPYTTLDLLDISHLNKEMEAVLKKLNNINDYRKIHLKVTNMLREAGTMRTKKEESLVEKLLQHPLLRNSKQASCAEAKACYYEIWSFYFSFKRDFVRGYKTSKEQCDFIETHFHQLRDPEKRHLFALNMSVIFIGYLLPSYCNMYGEMQDLLQKIRTYPTASLVLKATFWTSSYVNELNTLMLTSDFEKVFPAIKAIEENKELLNQAPVVYKMNLYYNMSYMLFGVGSYDEALHWIKKILDQPTDELRQDVQAGARILDLLIHYELHKDEEFLDSLKRSALHFLSTRHRFFKVEEALMYCLHQIMGKSISRKKRSAALQELKTSLLKLMKNPMEKAALEDFDFLSWVESKIQNKTFAEVVREKAKQSIGYHDH